MKHAADIPALLRTQADALAAQAVVLRAQADAIEAGGVAPPGASPKYATATHNPIGSERGFKAAARAGAFPTFKLGRQVAARWADVEAYAESRACSVRAPRGPGEADPDRAELERMGVRLRPANEPARSGRRTR